MRTTAAPGARAVVEALISAEGTVPIRGYPRHTFGGPLVPPSAHVTGRVVSNFALVCADCGDVAFPTDEERLRAAAAETHYSAALDEGRSPRRFAAPPAPPPLPSPTLPPRGTQLNLFSPFSPAPSKDLLFGFACRTQCGPRRRF